MRLLLQHIQLGCNFIDAQLLYFSDTWDNQTFVRRDGNAHIVISALQFGLDGAVDSHQQQIGNADS